MGTVVDREVLRIALDALNRIARCPEKDCAQYVAKVDAIAVEALVRIETWATEPAHPTPFTAATPLCGHRDAAGGLTPAGGTPQPHQISGDLAEAERADAPGVDFPLHSSGATA